VPTLESQGLQPIADGLLVGAGVAVAAGEVALDQSGFTTVTTGDKNQRKEENKKREAAREKELREERKKRAEELKRQQRAAKAGGVPAPKSAGEVAGGDEQLLSGLDSELGMMSVPRPHSIQDLNNQQAVPKVAWGAETAPHPVGKKPVSLLQVQVEEKFNKRLDPQFDEEVPMGNASSAVGSAVGGARAPGAPSAPGSTDLWASTTASAGDAFGSAFQNPGMAPNPGTTVLPTGIVPPDSFNGLQGLNMLNIRPAGAAPAGQSFAAPVASQPRFQALGLSMLGGTDPFASAFGAPAGGMDGWSSSAGVHPSNPFAAPSPAGDSPAAAMPFGEQTGAFGRQPASSSRHFGGGKRGPAHAAPHPGPTPMGESGGGQHNKGDKKHGKHSNGKGGDNNNNKGKGDSNGGKKNGGKNQQKNGRGGKKEAGGDHGGNGAAAPAATPRPAGTKADNSDSGNKGHNNNRSSKGGRRGGGDKDKKKGGDGSNAAAAKA